MRLAALPLLILSAVPVRAQTCPRPEAPYGGFAPQFELVVPVTMSDGYESFGTLILPQATTPTCGWPLVVFVHPLGQHRGYDQDLQLRVVSQGFAVWTFDVRAHGQAVAANPTHPQLGSTLWGPVEIVDLAEQISFVLGNTAWAGQIDPTRVAVIGASQGGAHAWSAAAWSDQLVQAPGRPSIAMPHISCVVAHDLVADMADDWIREGVLFGSFFVKVLAGDYDYTGVPFDAAFVQSGRTAFLNQDPTSLLSTFAAERGVRAALATSTVPVLFTHSYHDFISDPRAGLEALQTLDGPKRALLGTGGHGTPANAAEISFRDSMTLRWFHRFLWAVPNEVELEAPFILAELPLSAAQHDDTASAWNHAHVADPLQPPTAARHFLQDDFTLQPQPPAAPAAGATVDQVIAQTAVSFDPAGWLDLPSVRDLANVLLACPLDERVYALTTSGDNELAHSARVHLRIVPDGPQWMLAALLTVQPPGEDTQEFMLCSRAIASRSSVAGVAEDHDFVLPPVAARVPDGSTIRLRLRNLWLDEYPKTRQLATVPLFHDFSVAVVHGDAPEGSWIDLPLEPVRPKLVSTTTTLDLATLPSFTMTLRGGVSRANRPYLLAVGMGGQVPATSFLDEIVPIEPDWLVGVSVASSEAPYFAGFLGFLDANGEAVGTLDFSSIAPMPTFLSGWNLTAVGFVWDYDFAPTGASTQPLDVQFR